MLLNKCFFTSYMAVLLFNRIVRLSTVLFFNVSVTEVSADILPSLRLLPSLIFFLPFKSDSCLVCKYVNVILPHFVFNASFAQEEEALLAEMEVTGQAFEDMQEQNTRLLQQLREKDEANFKLMAEVSESILVFTVNGTLDWSTPNLVSLDSLELSVPCEQVGVTS